jgi:hypothetical protein
MTAHQEGGREEILDEPELDGAIRVAENTENHDADESLRSYSELRTHINQPESDACLVKET